LKNKTKYKKLWEAYEIDFVIFTINLALWSVKHKIKRISFENSRYACASFEQ
jgi:hypothetical protein